MKPVTKIAPLVFVSGACALVYQIAWTRELRLVFVLTDFQGLEPGAWIEDVKTGLSALVKEHSAWKRFALVTDVSWVAKATDLFSWMTPGEVKILGLEQLEEAKQWVAA